MTIWSDADEAVRPARGSEVGPLPALLLRLIGALLALGVATAAPLAAGAAALLAVVAVAARTLSTHEVQPA